MAGSSSSNNFYKYLVFNHPEDANIKTILAYEYPSVSLQPGYLNFDNATSSTTIDVTYSTASQTVTEDFTWGGPTPVESDFATTQSWLTVGNLVIDQAAGTGSIDVTVTWNGSPNTSNRYGEVQYGGDTSSPNQITYSTNPAHDASTLDIKQNGNTVNVK